MTHVYFTAAMLNHLWQSTVFAGIAGVLALALRANHARTRHWLWLIASTKFLIPFSLLSTVGSQLARMTGCLFAKPLATPQIAAVVAQISLPFPPLATPTAASPHLFAAHADLLPQLLIALWTCGFLAVVFSDWRRWRRIRAAVRVASPVGIQSGVPVRSSRAMLEPGVYGIFRPVLLLPDGIADRLSSAHLKAILAHEICHIRRRDNLAAAIHMMVEAIYWFHPLVWWIGARLVEERERACDEEVLRLENQPETYAESILKTCQFYLESPLACVSGISGADLKKRIVRIMTHRAARELSVGRKLLLATAGVAALAGPIAFGLLNAPRVRAQSTAPTSTARPTFDVASIKPSHLTANLFRVNAEPGRFAAENASVIFLLQYAYRVKNSQVSGGPGWLDSDHYNIEAKQDETAAAELRKLSSDKQEEQLRLMVQSLLADRFKLALHHEAKEMQIYALIVAKNGPKLHASTIPPDDSVITGPPPPDAAPRRRNIRMGGRGDLSVSGEDLDMFAEVLSHFAGRMVVNQTGLKGTYDFDLKWTPEAGSGPMPGEAPGDAAPPPDASGPSLFTALEEQLGLKLESQKGPVDTIVIDHVEKPSEN